jgi:hypothetical protein
VDIYITSASLLEQVLLEFSLTKSEHVLICNIQAINKVSTVDYFNTSPYTSITVPNYVYSYSYLLVGLELPGIRGLHLF